MRRTSLKWVTVFAAWVMAAIAAWGAVGNDAAPQDDPATLRILNRDIVTMRARIASLTPQARVRRARERLQALPDEAIALPINTVQFQSGETRGVQFLLGDLPLFSVVEGDVDPEAKQDLHALVEQTREHMEVVHAAWGQMRSRPLLLHGVARALGATLLFCILTWVTHRGMTRIVGLMEKRRDVLAARFSYVDWREFLARVVVGMLQVLQWLVLLALVYSWAHFVLASFVATAPIANDLGDWLVLKLSWLAEGALDSLPGLATVLIVLALTRAIVDLLGYLFDALQQGRLRLPLLHPDTVSATRRIFTAFAWCVGIAVAYPFLPGASSDVFKGLSVLFGVMVTLGSTGLVTQLMSGLVVVYSRSLHKGDFVDINGVQGVVTEVAALATKITNVRNDEITIPNSVVIASPIHNYSKLSGTHGTLLSTKVTIGYDAPWRQVHALLIEAACKTNGVRATPAPYVYQRALSDFYVEYELFASIEKPADRIPVLSALHASIQDAFNEHGVQIMSPHFLGQPEHSVVVPKGQWYASPASPVSSVASRN
ncbi:mechanosensitive ion channel family protein [Variovorax sp. Sphag1AA]|uniref:mechanosensitive ion channel family protein n=1 Tax=Variovorax sp. Sphag1AA TaxID=2587027 RepID=UPI00161E3002|nr:mechanosensitive ion channel domain-containing protein [Variovorax sp. Sphag1AA]MBB3176799.1 small-conductance mechanosensitive channel [Variovorax sp. Sphag1AA]